MQKFKIRLVTEDEEKELIAMANTFSDLQKLLRSHYTLNNYQSMTIHTMCNTGANSSC